MYAPIYNNGNTEENKRNADCTAWAGRFSTWVKYPSDFGKLPRFSGSYIRRFEGYFPQWNVWKIKAHVFGAVWKIPIALYMKGQRLLARTLTLLAKKMAKQDKGVLLTSFGQHSWQTFAVPAHPLTHFIRSGPLLRRFAPCPPGPDIRQKTAEI